MTWDYKIADTAWPDLRRIGPSGAAIVRDYLDKRIKGSTDPSQFGKPLRGALKGYWRYRVQDYRILCRLQNGICIVEVVRVGHRSTVYD